MKSNFGHLSNDDYEEMAGIFYSQSHEIIEDLQDFLLKLDTGSGDNNILKSIKREIHTLKGDANSFGLTSIGTLCHRMEDIFLSFLLDESVPISHNAVDLLLNCVDTIDRLLIESESGKDGTDIKELMEKIDDYLTPLNPPLA
ncbi:MAG: Hpt domain-containing protein, partial [Nitrospirae bacterium]|nr:Hpt domain-containing protein [Nitrospirota bacterium]